MLFRSYFYATFDEENEAMEFIKKNDKGKKKIKNFKNYYFSGERYNFWEILYVDRGEIIVETDRLERPAQVS